MTLGDEVAVLRDGRLEQVDTPQDLYDHPRNMFVAGFVGSPPMNLLEARLERRQGYVYAVLGGGCLRVPDETMRERRSLEYRLGREVVLGIRPEHLEDEALVDRSVRDRGAAFDVEVDAVEWLGAEQFVYVPWDAPPELVEPLNRLAAELDREVTRPQLVARLDPRSDVRPGQKARLWFDPANVHIFDVGTGERLTPSRLKGHVSEHQDSAGDRAHS